MCLIMNISVVIPTCNRREALLYLLKSLDHSSYPIREVIIVDGGQDHLRQSDYETLPHLNINYLISPASVCMQRNIGILSATSSWIFICDDDMEVPADYLQKLVTHIASHPEAGAVTGRVLQREQGNWTDFYPVSSSAELIWKFIFQLGLWGEIRCKSKNILIKKIKAYYQRKGNHLSPAGWPVITKLSGDYFTVPAYGLGASLIKKTWLQQSPYDESLDIHGIGDHYGVAAGFPNPGIHVLNPAYVYHHRSPQNRLIYPVQYFHRVLALDHFRRNIPKLKHIKKIWLLWSLFGNLLGFLYAKNRRMVISSLRAIAAVALGKNTPKRPINRTHASNKYRKHSKGIKVDSWKAVNQDPYIPCRPWTNGQPPKKILAIRLQATGDTVITLPYLQYLRRHLPQSVRIDLLTRKETDDVPKNIYLFDKIYSLGGKRHFRKQVLFTFLLLPRLLMQRYDVVIDLQNNFISNMVRRVLQPGAWSVFDRFSPRAAGERTRLTIEAIGLGANQMDTIFHLKDTAKGKNILLDNGWDGSSQMVVLNPAAAFETRHWPMPYYVQFAKLWHHHYPNTQFIALGTDFIAEKTKFLLGELGNSLINLVSNTGPFDAFAVIQHVTLVLSEDSGLMHMAWVSGIPTLALFGGTRSDWARPLGRHSRFLDSSDLPCGNCMLEECPFGTVHCLTRYTPERVFEEAVALLESLHATTCELKN